MYCGNDKTKKWRRKMKKITKVSISFIFVMILVVAVPVGVKLSKKLEVKADTALNTADITKELTKKRSRFTKQFMLSDGTFLASTYSMPVHYKKNGKWKEVDTTLRKTKNKKFYKTKSTSLEIKVARKANPKATLVLKRGNHSLSLAFVGKKGKKSEAIIRNPKKKEKTDILNENKVQYKKIAKNTKLTYEIYPEKITEIITIQKKQKANSFTFKVQTKKLKIKVKNNRIYFKNKKGKTKYTRLKTIFTDANGVSTAKEKVKYNKKKQTITITVDKKWWNRKERKFPIQARTAWITDRHERDVRIGASYKGAPKANYKYDSSLLLKAGKCISYVKMSQLAELNKPNVKILSAKLQVENETDFQMGAGNTFDLNLHKVTQKWVSKYVTYKNRPTYAKEIITTLSMQKKGRYTCDVTDVVKDWYQGEKNYGIALVADKRNGAYQAKIKKQPAFMVRYEVVGFDGAVELKEGQELIREVLQAGQENYYYFDAKPGIAYVLTTSSNVDTQGTLYNTEKVRLQYDDNSGLENNFAFVQSYEGRRYLKVGTKGTATGTYTLSLKPYFAIPTLTGKNGKDSYTVSWNSIDKATEYVVSIYDANGKINETVVTETSYEYVYTNETRGKTLAFTVTPRSKETLKGEDSRPVYNTNKDSQWTYTTPMTEELQQFSSITYDKKIYVLGGANKEENTVSKSLYVYDTEKERWNKVSDYPGNVSGICNATMVEADGKIYVLGGQTDITNTAKNLKEVYCYDVATNTWTKKADMPESRSSVIATECNGSIYTFAKAGSTERVDTYNIKEDVWNSDIKADNSINIQAQTVDGRIFVLREKQDSEDALGEQMYWEEYLPETGEYDNAGEPSTIANANRFVSGTVVNGKIYMVNAKESNQVIYYDVYLDEWSELSILNLKKEASQMQSVGNTLYNLGGSMAGFGTLDVVESYTLETTPILKQLDVVKGETYELQVNAGNCEEDTDYLVTVRINPAVLAYTKASSFMAKEELEGGKDGIQLMHYAPKKGVMVLKLRSKMETGETFQAYQSIPVVGLEDKNTVVRMEIEK